MSKTAPRRSLFDLFAGRRRTPAKKAAPKKPASKKLSPKKSASKKPSPKKSAPKKTNRGAKAAPRATTKAPARSAGKLPPRSASRRPATKKAGAKPAPRPSGRSAARATTRTTQRRAPQTARALTRLTPAARARAKAAAAAARRRAAAERVRTQAAAVRARRAAARVAARAKQAARRAATRARIQRLREAAKAKAAKAKAAAVAKRERRKAAATAKRERLKQIAANKRLRAAEKAARAKARAEAQAARAAAKAQAKAEREAARAQAKASRAAAKAEAQAAREAARLARSLARGSDGATSRSGRSARTGGSTGAAARALSMAQATLARRSLMPAHIADLTLERLQELHPSIDPEIALLLIELIEDEVPTQSEIVAAHERWSADRPEGEQIPLSLLTDAFAAIGLEPSAERSEGDELSAIVNAFALQSAVAPVPLSEIQEAFEKMAASIEAAGAPVPTIERFIGAIAAAGVQINDEEEDDDLPAVAEISAAAAGDYSGASWDAYSQWRREVANHKILSREEETEITHRYAFYRSSVESLTASIARLDEQIAAVAGAPAVDPAEAARLAEIAALMAEDPEAAAALRSSGVDLAAVVQVPAGDDPQRAAIVAERATIVSDIEAAQDAMRRTEDHFLRCNYKLVLKHARAFYEAGRRRIDLMDIVQQGNTGMVEAFRRFDPTRGFKFSTFATFHIKQKISEWSRERGSSIRVPTFRQREWARLNAYKAEFYNAHGRQPTDEELAEKFGKTEKKIKEIFAAEALSVPSSIDKPVSEEDGAATMGELIEDVAAIDPEEHLIRTHVANEIADALMRCLTPRERRVIQSRFGLYTGSRETLEEIGRRMRITRERVRQIEARAIEKLRADGTIRGMQGSKAGFAGVPWAMTDEQD